MSDDFSDLRRRKKKKDAEEALHALSFGLFVQQPEQQPQEKDTNAGDNTGTEDGPTVLNQTTSIEEDEEEEDGFKDEEEYSDDDEADEDDLSRRLSSFRKVALLKKNKDDPPSLEGLSEDVSTLILSHLSLTEIATVSCLSKSLYVACRSNLLWKRLLHNRWNLTDAVISSCGADNFIDTDQDVRYFLAYQSAHLHPHDLWITHWNCTYPCEGLLPGRCCISKSTHNNNKSNKSNGRTTTRKKKRNLEEEDRCCPKCRDWDGWERATSSSSRATPPQTKAQAMARATLRTRRKFRNLLHSQDGSSSSSNRRRHLRRSRRAFEVAGTFHRKLQTRQYEEDSSLPTNFLTDALFFNITSPIFSDGQWELEEFLQHYGQEYNEHDPTNINHNHLQDNVNTPNNSVLTTETTNHSWHLIKLTNPDWLRPLIFQFAIQRPECFTCYPSEGWVGPGESTTVTLGIRPIGGAMSYAFEALNLFRDGLEADWAQVYSDQAHLPLAPFMVRYRFAISPPNYWADIMHHHGRPFHHHQQQQQQQPHAADDSHRDNANNANQSRNRELENKAALDYHWKQPVPPHCIKTIHISAHVHSHYSFWKFLQDTCRLFVVKHDGLGVAGGGGCFYSSPTLQEVYPSVFKRLENVEPETHRIMWSHTENPCTCCGRSWGLRHEEMAQAYWVAQQVCTWHQQRQIVLLRNIETCMRWLNKERTGLSTQFSALLYKISRIIQSMKAEPWISKTQTQLLLRIEAQVDDLYHQIVVGGEEWVPWKDDGLYRFRLCSDSVFGQTLLGFEDSIEATWKDEPDYLDAFRHLAHSPGRYCLGPQEDPNHLFETVVPSSGRYFRIQKGISTDLFMDDPILSLQVGICMMSEPRSLLGHGLYDRIPYAGNIVHRPRELLPPQLIPVTNSRKDEDGRVIAGETVGAQLVASSRRFAYYQLQDSMDLVAVAEGYIQRNNFALMTTTLSMQNFLNNIPPPGLGPLPDFDTDTDEFNPSGGEDATRPQGGEEAAAVPLPGGAPPRNHHRGGARFLQLLWVLGAQLGLAVSDNPCPVFVDRRILIACQWFCISLMTVPHFLTLFAQYCLWIPSRPVDYELEGLPFEAANEMRFLTERECGCVAILLCCVWLALGRWTERHVSRDFFRIMLEHQVTGRQESRLLSRWRLQVLLWVQHQWDAVCPLFLQRRIFQPHWNRRSRDELLQHISFWRSINLPEQRSAAEASTGHQHVFGDSRREEGVVIGGNSQARNLVVGIFVALGSFCSSSPHFWLNFFTIFSCSISLGMSVSCSVMEKSASSVTVSSTTGSLITTLSLVTVVILAFLIGQLVGSSGGTMFLAEFIVTSVSLLLGGAGTISANAMESWGCFFCLSTTAFWGYLFGRAALMDGIRHKRAGYSSILLTSSIVGLFFFWMLIFVVSKWESPLNLVVIDQIASIPEEGYTWNRKQRAKKLQ